MPLWCNKHLPGKSTSIIIAFEFFGMCVSTRTLNFFWAGGSCACFRYNIPFFRPSSHCLWPIDFDNQQHFVLTCLRLIVCHWRAFIFANKFCHFGSPIVTCRGITRLDGACGKKQVWRSLVRTWGLSKTNVLFWKIEKILKNCFWHFCDFWYLALIRRAGNRALLLRLWCYAIKIGKFSENKQIFMS